MNVAFSPDVLLSDQVPIYFYLEPRGDVEFLPPRELNIPPMYYGERYESQPEGTKGDSIHACQDLQSRRARASDPSAVRRTR